MNFLLMDATTTGTANNGLFGGNWILIVYVVVIGAMMYFMIIKPQRKQRKEQENLMNNMAIGDSVMTTAGFYGVIIDMTDDTVIVEFGNNKNCRIPMQKQAIVQIEKPVDPSAN